MVLREMTTQMLKRNQFHKMGTGKKGRRTGEMKERAKGKKDGKKKVSVGRRMEEG